MTMEVPNEILFEVIATSERSALRGFCLVSKQCRDIAQPYLFQTFAENDNIRLLLRTLTISPHLAMSVRSVTLKEFFPETDAANGRPELPTLQADELALFQSAVDGFPLPEPFKHRLRESFVSANLEGEVTLLALLCTRLETLELPYAAYSLKDTLLIELGRLQVSQFLPSLRELSVRHGDTEMSTAIRNFAPLLSAPNLQSLKGHMLGPLYSRVSCPKLKSIKLTYSDLDAEAIADLLASSPALETFSMQWGSAIVGNRQIRWDDIGEALRKHGKHLQYLILDTQHAEEYDDDPFKPPMGDLGSLSVLKHLNVPEVALLGEDDDLDDNYPNFEMPRLSDILPKSLESLTIEHYGAETEELFEAITELMDNSKESRLCSIRIKRAGGLEDFTPQVSPDGGWRLSIKRNVTVFRRPRGGGSLE